MQINLFRVLLLELQRCLQSMICFLFSKYFLDGPAQPCSVQGRGVSSVVLGVWSPRHQAGEAQQYYRSHFSPEFLCLLTALADRLANILSSQAVFSVQPSFHEFRKSPGCRQRWTGRVTGNTEIIISSLKTKISNIN